MADSDDHYKEERIRQGQAQIDLAKQRMDVKAKIELLRNASRERIATDNREHKETLQSRDHAQKRYLHDDRIAHERGLAHDRMRFDADQTERKIEAEEERDQRRFFSDLRLRYVDFENSKGLEAYKAELELQSKHYNNVFDELNTRRQIHTNAQAALSDGYRSVIGALAAGIGQDRQIEENARLDELRRNHEFDLELLRSDNRMREQESVNKDMTFRETLRQRHEIDMEILRFGNRIQELEISHSLDKDKMEESARIERETRMVDMRIDFAKMRLSNILTGTENDRKARRDAAMEILKQSFEIARLIRVQDHEIGMRTAERRHEKTMEGLRSKYHQSNTWSDENARVVWRLVEKELSGNGSPTLEDAEKAIEEMIDTLFSKR